MIQPFDDGGKFDKRYADVFEPAIQDAGLEPYRVDNDPSVTIPIEEIQDGIRRASMCLADITLDNPNVWFELGYALAIDKEICLICSEERTGKYPFDVQHRTIAKYRVESKSDYSRLQSTITERLKAIIEKSVTLAKIDAQSPIKEPEGLSQHEMIVLASTAENQQGVGDSVAHSILRQELGRFGYNNLALNIGMGGLIEREMIASGEGRGYAFEDTEYTYIHYTILPKGMKWIRENYGRLNLKFAIAKGQIINDLDDDEPF